MPRSRRRPDRRQPQALGGGATANPLAALRGTATGWTPLIEELVAAAQQRFHGEHDHRLADVIQVTTDDIDGRGSADRAA